MSMSGLETGKCRNCGNTNPNKRRHQGSCRTVHQSNTTEELVVILSNMNKFTLRKELGHNLKTCPRRMQSNISSQAEV